MAEKFFEEKRPHNGMSYAKFTETTDNYLVETNPEELDEKARGMYDYTKLNAHRSMRIWKTFTPEESLVELMNEITESQVWMVITENWCGDSAQNLPYLAKIADLNSNITFRILERDKNPDIMDKYLTNGTSRSIPKLVAFDEEGNELFQWGPRPAEAQELVEKRKAEGVSNKQFIEELHMWYAKNRGKALQSEIRSVLRGILAEKTS